MIAPRITPSEDSGSRGVPSTPPCFEMVSSVQSVMSNSLWPHEPQHTRPPCPSPTARVHPNPCPFSQWCHATISSSVVPFSSCPQSFPPSGSFKMSQLFPSGGQSIGVSASTSVLPMNTKDWSPLGWTGWNWQRGCPKRKEKEQMWHLLAQSSQAATEKTEAKRVDSWNQGLASGSGNARKIFSGLWSCTLVGRNPQNVAQKL